MTSKDKKLWEDHTQSELSITFDYAENEKNYSIMLSNHILQWTKAFLVLNNYVTVREVHFNSNVTRLIYNKLKVVESRKLIGAQNGTSRKN